MTSQIVIKLNEKKFRPILDCLKPISLGRSYSEIAGFCIWYCSLCSREKVPELGNKTRKEFLSEKLGASEEQRVIDLIMKFNEFLGHKKPGDHSRKSGK